MDIKKIISSMTLEEKAGMCSGGDFWHTKAVERLGIPEVMVSDGPGGLRKQEQGGDHMGVNKSIKAVCFPAGCAIASSFDRELMKNMGVTLGKECQAKDVSVILGPAVNIKRSPLCGRNFEYLSEDPYLAGELAAAYIGGVQSQHIGTSMKHFALNNQEHERMSCSAEVDERTMREIYLAAFEKAVKQSQPWTIMCSYNRINGTYASEDHKLLTEILRDEWGFKGYVMSDWGAVNDRVKGLEAGLDLEMPGGNRDNDRLIVEAVKNGKLPEDVVDTACERILNKVKEYTENRQEEPFDMAADHDKSAEIAKQCMVLLKNDQNILPLDKNENGILFVGAFAKAPRFQGGGSSHVNSYRITDAFSVASAHTNIDYCEGFHADNDIEDADLENKAIGAAKKASKVVIFAGLPDKYESEGYDREHMRLPEAQDKLIERICSVNENVIVILHNGSPVEMPWISKVKGVLEAYLGGEAVGKAVDSILFGDCNPSGRLAETFPVRLEDNPSYLNFPGKQGKVDYAEGLFIGYRYYDSKNMKVLFPFGYGLSYTTFKISGLKLSSENIMDSDVLRVQVDVTNTGNMAGREVVQLYVRDETGEVIRPDKELKGFTKVFLEPGETKTVEMDLDKRSFSYYDTENKDWTVAAGNYTVLVGNSSRDISTSAMVAVRNAAKRKPVFTKDTIISELLKYNGTEDIVKRELLPQMHFIKPDSSNNQEDGSDSITDDMENAMEKYMPIHAFRSFGDMTNEQVSDVVRRLNEKVKI